MPLLRQSVELGLNVRRSLFTTQARAYSQWTPSQPLARSQHRLSPSRCPASDGLSRACLSTGGPTARLATRALAFYRLLMSSSLRERIYDNLILFTRMLHQQSNVYLCLRLRRLTQICSLYHRLYSPHEFKNLFLDRILDRLKHFTSLLNRSAHLNMLYRHRLLLSFASVGLFSWEENRITDQELQDLMKEFMIGENSHAHENNPSEEEQHESYGTADFNSDQHSPVAKLPPHESSFMVVNCLQATKKSPEKWEEVINQPNFHVWRKSVNNTSLYEYKVFGSFFDISAYSFYTVQRDLHFRKEWDKLVLKLDIIGVEPEYAIPKTSKNIDDSGNELVHWIMKYPYPMRSREYLFIRRSRVDFENRFIVLVSRSILYPDVPETDEHVRVYDYMSQMVIRPHQDNFYDFGFDYMLTYFDDPRASFPSPAYNWMASRGVPDFVEKMHQAALSMSASKAQFSPTAEADPLTNHENASHTSHKGNKQSSQSHSKTSDEDEERNETSSATSTCAVPKKDKQRALGVTSQASNNNVANFDRNQKNKNNETNTFSFKSLSIWN